WSLIRILHCPARSPLSFSSLFAGGTVRSSRVIAASSIRNFRRQGRCRSVGSLRERWRLNNLSPSASAQVLITYRTITADDHNVKRYRCIPAGLTTLMLSRVAAPPSGSATRSVAHERGGSAAGPNDAATSAPATSWAAALGSLHAHPALRRKWSACTPDLN